MESSLGANESSQHPQQHERTTSLLVYPFGDFSDEDEHGDEDGALRQHPSAEVMEQRQEFRQGIARETLEHRRNAPNVHKARTCRNILFTLYHRELHSARQSTLYSLPRRGTMLTNTKKRARCLNEMGTDAVGSGKKDSTQYASSPISTITSPPSLEGQTQNVEQPLQESPSEDDEDMDVSEEPVTMEAPAQLSIQTQQARSETTTDTTPVHSTLLWSKDLLELSERKRPKHSHYPLKIHREIQRFAEHVSSTGYQSAFLHHLGGDEELDDQGNRPMSSTAVSTISIAFSPDGNTIASTHGDHTVKVSCCNTGRLLQSLEGHSRTPWTVKYHPLNPDILASGCLGHQVRIWNWRTKECLQMVRLEHAIISLSFHPTGKVLAIANGTRLHCWGIDPAIHGNGSPTDPAQRTYVTEMDQRHMLRCVHFPPGGKTIIIGGVNPMTDDTRRRGRSAGGGMSFYLRLWDFDLERALHPQPTSSAPNQLFARRPISNPRTFVPRALLYNDGGFDVSPDGKTLCACAEYWLPDGVDNAMDLVYQEEKLYGADGNMPSESTALGEGDTVVASPDNSGVASAETKIAVAAALSKLRGISREAEATKHAFRSPSFREGMEQPLPRAPSIPPQTPPVLSSESHAMRASSDGQQQPNLDFVPQTPPNPVASSAQRSRLSPPSPPGRRFPGGVSRPQEQPAESDDQQGDTGSRGLATPPPPPPPPAPNAPSTVNIRPPHPLSIVSCKGSCPDAKGRYVPHVVTVSLDTTPIPEEVEPQLPRGKPPGAVASRYRPRLGQLLEACPLDPGKASAVTCVKFSPSTDYCLIGYGVREPVLEGSDSAAANYHPVTTVYRVNGGMAPISTMLSGEDDVNIARFHPDSGYGFVYGTKQGRVRILSPRPWNYYS